ISTYSMLIFILLNAIIFIAMSALINPLCFYLSFPILLILGIYSLMKRFSSLSHLVLGLCLGISPIAGAIAVNGEIPLWSIPLCLGVLFWVAGFDLLYSLQDISHDKKEKLHSIPVCLGVKKTLHLSRFFHCLTLIFWALFIQQANLGAFMWIGLAIASIMLFYEQFLVTKNFHNIPRAFFTVNGWLGVIFLGFCMIDIIN
ncbi:MAG: putative 4-hydroxybenzoate polyprenyltransferase, partial [Helicobacter sp.]|nr:putative 4-hydroxybenzoate polyprenyltransferase [Helicobacter sp.]